MKGQSSSKRAKTLLSFFSKVGQSSESTLHDGLIEDQPSIPIPQNPPTPTLPEIGHSVVSTPELPCANIERDPRKIKPMFDHPINTRDEVRIVYLKVGPYQPKLTVYARIEGKTQSRSFQKKWFTEFPWLEYSPSTEKAYCFYCFLFQKNDNSSKSSKLISDGFNNWKRVKDGKKCAFLTHASSTDHNMYETRGKDLMRPSQHIDKVIHTVSEEELQKRRLRLMTSIRNVLWLALQSCSYRGNDESPSSLKRGNFLHLLRFAGDSNPAIDKVILENAPKNNQYIAPVVQKEILHIMASRVRRMIREEVGDGYFCILVDEAQDTSKREQMDIVLRYVDNQGILKERFFAIKRVSDTTSLNLKNEICHVLAQHELDVKKMRGQGYDGANNMRGAWNGLQALFLRDCQYAYYVHCFARRLQLTLVTAAKDVHVIWNFFSHLDNIVNLITSSPKRVNELQTSHREEIQRMLATGERESGRGVNQMVNLQGSGATRWSSHFESVKSLIGMYSATRNVLQYICDHCSKGRTMSKACGANKKLGSFKFVFILHLVHKIMRITDILCQTLQRRSQDILAAMIFVSIAKQLLQELREHGWEEIFEEVKTFCSKHGIKITNLDSLYNTGRTSDETTIEHYYHFDVFNEALDFVVVELNTRFSDTSVELLSLSAALDPKDSFQSFNIHDICTLAEKFYPEDFSTQYIITLEYELQHYERDVTRDSLFQVSTLAELCRKLFESRRSETYSMVTRLIHLVLTLPVSTASSERAFSTMKHVKTVVHKKMEDDFLDDSMVLNIERELAVKLDLNSILDEYGDSKPRREKLK